MLHTICNAQAKFLNLSSSLTVLLNDFEGLITFRDTYKNEFIRLKK